MIALPMLKKFEHFSSISQWSRDEQNPLFESSELKFFNVFFFESLYTFWKREGEN